MAEVRSKTGAATVSDFSGSTGTPIVVDQTTGDIAVLKTGDTVFIVSSDKALLAGSASQAFSVSQITIGTNASSSGSFTITTNGLTVDQSGTATYHIINGICQLTVPFLSGTSGYTSFSLTGLPAACQSSITPFFNVAGLIDNSVSFTSGIGKNSGSTIVLWKDLSGLASWTASGTKGIYNCTFSYPLS